jgi:hypothetical protein
MSRLSDLVRFYALLDQLQQRLGGTRTLATFDRFRDWPERGLYFFFEPTEARKESGAGLRVVRVGTHALGTGSRSTLRQRLNSIAAATLVAAIIGGQYSACWSVKRCWREATYLHVLHGA